MKKTLVCMLAMTAMVMESSCTADAGKAAEADIRLPEDGWVEPSATDHAETTGATTDSIGIILADTLPK